jgi:CheY-like chemotaxis protein
MRQRPQLRTFYATMLVTRVEQWWVEAASAEEAQELAPPTEPSAPHRRGRQETILVVEDNSDVRSVAVALLAELGYQTVEAETAAAGMDMLERGHVDLVFTDVVLPGAMDGLALAQKITTVRPELPVVLTTGYARSLDGDPGYAVLRKPYDLSSLGRVIRAAIDAKGGRQPAGRGQRPAVKPSFAR